MFFFTLVGIIKLNYNLKYIKDYNLTQKKTYNKDFELVVYVHNQKQLFTYRGE